MALPLSVTASAPQRQPHLAPLSQIKGVGPALEKKLAKAGIVTVEDALYTLPLRYEDRREIRKIAQLRDGCREIFHATVLAAGEVVSPRSRRRLFELIAGDGSGKIVLKWFHYRKDWMLRRYAVGRSMTVSGEIKRFGAIREIHHPDIEFANGEGSEPFSRSPIAPVYPLTEGLHQKTARNIWSSLIDNNYTELCQSTIPPEIFRQRDLMPLPLALRQLHRPDPAPSWEQIEIGLAQARRSLVYDEFFFLELGLALRRRGLVMEQGHPFTVNHRYTRPLAQSLPFRLTAAQRRVLGEIKNDLMSSQPMHRLIQGDVGSGKTIVALMAALVAIENNTQVAVVAPTEILAEQHFLQFHRWMEKLGLSVVYLAGGLGQKERRDTLQRIRNGETHMVVGTHAILQEDVEFQHLGLGIIDEQHRFGVRQRGVLRKKGDHPHMLVMTATPIPRTLAMTVYGDLALSVIDELPPGRTAIKTRIVAENGRNRVYDFIRREVTNGRQAYIVYPLVEESDKSALADATAGAKVLEEEVFPDLRVGLLHGRLKPEEKERVMASFKEHELDILVATTVVEVGVDVPNASVIVIEHAERFGLSQLHQLRGRVGRGEHPSHCFLLRSFPCSEEAQKRLMVMEETTDGFRIAEADLEIRGPGEFLGTKQSGLAEFRVANLQRDGRTLEEAREDAFRLAADPDILHGDKYRTLRQTLLERWGSRLELAHIG